MPTLLELAGLRYPDEYNGHVLPPLPGESLLPVFREEKTVREGPLYFEHFGGRALIDGEWKIVSLARQPWELHNLGEDPTEVNDQVGAFPGIFDRMTGMYRQWADSIGVIPIDDLKSHQLPPQKSAK